MAIINRYREGVPLPKRLLEDVRYRFRRRRLYYLNNKTHETVLFYPQYPSKRAVLYKLLGILNYNRTNNPGQDYNLVVNWEDTTFRNQYSLLDDIAADKGVVNYNCKDISKKHVDEVFNQVFGYRTRVDPRTYKGKCLQKNDLNALHDGIEITAPIKNPRKDCIYQIIINNKYDENLVEDIRVPVIGSSLPFGYLKYKPMTGRYGSFLTSHDFNKDTEIVKINDVFKSDEIEMIKQFVIQFGLEYGELDILRNRDDGKIYIIDANNTPTGPSHLDKSTRRRVLNILAETFKREFLDNPRYRIK
ncbi:MAG: hypothetical protein ACLFUC_05585 [Bacteroidales bacterium]